MQALHGQTVVIVDGGAASDAPARQAFAQDVALLALTGVRPIGVPRPARNRSTPFMRRWRASIMNWCA